MNCVSCDIDYACTTFGLFVFFPRVFLSPRVTGACPVATHLILRVNVRTTTTTATTSEARKRNHYARPGQAPFDERSYKLATLVVESFGRPGIKGSDLIDQVAASIVGGTDASSLARKGVCMERLFQIISVTTQVAISRRVHRFRLSLRNRQTEGKGGRIGRTTTTGLGWQCCSFKTKLSEIFMFVE